jgi:hypothetical protein
MNVVYHNQDYYDYLYDPVKSPDKVGMAVGDVIGDNIRVNYLPSFMAFEFKAILR